MLAAAYPVLTRNGEGSSPSGPTQKEDERPPDTRPWCSGNSFACHAKVASSILAGRSVATSSRCETLQLDVFATEHSGVAKSVKHLIVTETSEGSSPSAGAEFCR